jgi:hypothetical protein
MREISPRDEPVAFTEWRAGSQNDINYGYRLIPGELLKQALRKHIKRLESIRESKRQGRR